MDRDKLLLWCKQQELDALNKAKATRIDCDCAYFDGKANAFSEVWEHILSNGAGLLPYDYNRLHKRWERAVKENS